MVNHEQGFIFFSWFTCVLLISYMILCRLVISEKSYCIFGSDKLVIFLNDSANKSIASFPDIEILLPNVLGVNILLQG